MTETPRKTSEAISKTGRRGCLKIFFGYSAGAGKTYAMLKAARAAKNRGTDVVVGFAETHSQPKTGALLNGFEVLPLLHGEFDLDGALKRAPGLLILDMLAHTNAKGCRHARRYQDVEELLKAGIDVYTTANVQDIESLNDMVASITGSSVGERIPDSIFDNADQVELVDVEPQELIERLNGGFKKGPLTQEKLAALRELALRRCADRVNLLTEHTKASAANAYRTDEHILVCLSSAPSNAKLIRTAARMASAFRGTFTALFVETPDFSVMSSDDKARLRANMRLAQQLGAKIETVCGEDISLQIAEFARLSGVSKIVIGRSTATRRGFFKKPALTDRLIANAPNLDIHIIPDSMSSILISSERMRFALI